MTNNRETRKVVKSEVSKYLDMNKCEKKGNEEEGFGRDLEGNVLVTKQS